MIELRIEGQAVDVAPDTKITLNFNSNIFGDISKITPSNSLTITLPKTPKNAKVFGAPSVVGGSSIAPYRRWNAELYVNGVAMVDTAYAVLLSVGESYEIALYWGVVTALSTLKDNDNTLADLGEVLKEQKAIGRNINQITTLCNMGKITCPDLQEVKQKYTEMLSVLNEIVRRCC